MSIIQFMNIISVEEEEVWGQKTNRARIKNIPELEQVLSSGKCSYPFPTYPFESF